MKVIHFIGSIDKTAGGTTEYIRLLSNALKLSIKLIVATGKSDFPITIDGVRIQFFDTNFFRWFSLLNEFRVFLKEENPDVVHINGIWSPQNWGFQKVAQELGIKVILSPHGMLEPWILAQNPWKKKLGLFLYQKKAIQQAVCLHATGQMEANNIRTLGFKTPTYIIPNGIDLIDVKEVKEFYGTKKMVFLSRIHPKKGIELLLQAWQNCNTEGWILEIAGNGDKNYIEQLSKSAQEIENLSFVGAKYGEDKWDFLRSADVMILPTYSENFGIVIAEALAVGLPVITTQGTPWEDLEIQQCGWWIGLSVLNLQNTIQNAMLTSESELRKMGQHGRKLVKEKYEMKVVTNEIIKLYQIIIN